MEPRNLKRTRRLYEDLRTQCCLVTFEDSRAGNTEALLLEITKPKPDMQVSLELYAKVTSQLPLQDFLLKPIYLFAQSDKVVALYEPVEDLMNAALGKSLRHAQWLEETGMPVFFFLSFSLWQVHRAGFVHGCISPQSVFLNKEGLYKIGPSTCFCAKQSLDLLALEDVKDLGNLFIRFLVADPACPVEDLGNSRRRERLLRLQIDDRLLTLLMDMTNDLAAQRIDAKEAFYAIEAMMPPPEKPFSPPFSRTLPVELSSEAPASPQPEDSELNKLLKDLERVVASPNVYSPALIKSLLARISQAHQEAGGDFKVEIAPTVDDCPKCQLRRRVRNMVLLDCRHFLCLPCMRLQAQDTLIKDSFDLDLECALCAVVTRATKVHLEKLRPGSKNLVETLLGRETLRG